MKMDPGDIRDALQVYRSFGFTKTEIANGAGVSRPWLDEFMAEPESKSSDKVDDLRGWLQRRAAASRTERKEVAAFLRWTARLLEETDLPLPIGLELEGSPRGLSGRVPYDDAREPGGSASDPPGGESSTSAE